VNYHHVVDVWRYHQAFLSVGPGLYEHLRRFTQGYRREVESEHFNEPLGRFTHFESHPP